RGPYGIGLIGGLMPGGAALAWAYRFGPVGGLTPGGAALARAYDICRPGKAKPPPGVVFNYLNQPPNHSWNFIIT
ncbi:hypothetical protein K5I32_23385, partial [Leclercia sp. LTM01]|uniref:hypothetical protein n=1 Tax=Leclercia sp. LTM01 TaxID=2870836 RepID=UPI0020747AF4